MWTIIPRGGKGLIERISAEARVPVIKHLDGNCHTYVDSEVDLDLAVKVTDNAKTQSTAPATRPSPAGACKASAAFFAPALARSLHPRAWKCGRTRAKAILADVPGANVVDATEQDWFEEYLPRDCGEGGGLLTRPLRTSTATARTTPIRS